MLTDPSLQREENKLWCPWVKTALCMQVFEFAKENSGIWDSIFWVELQRQRCTHSQDFPLQLDINCSLPDDSTVPHDTNCTLPGLHYTTWHFLYSVTGIHCTTWHYSVLYQRTSLPNATNCIQTTIAPIPLYHMVYFVLLYHMASTTIVITATMSSYDTDLLYVEKEKSSQKWPRQVLGNQATIKAPKFVR